MDFVKIIFQVGKSMDKKKYKKIQVWKNMEFYLRIFQVWNCIYELTWSGKIWNFI